MIDALARPFVVDGRLRPLWRAVLFFGLGSWVLFPFLLDPVFMRIAMSMHIAPSLNPLGIAVGEFELFVGALLLTALFALYERRRVTDYGLPLRQAFRARFWEGIAIGIASAGIVAIGMIATGAMRVDGLALSGSHVAIAALAWLGCNIVIGFGEELWYRGYILQTLWKALGFWPAAIVLALIFTSDHYFFKRGENLYDVVTLFSLGLMMCYSVLRTGSLWFAIGFHIAFDFMQLFVIGTRNGSLVPADHLLNASFPGPDVLTGGPLGTEASVLMYPVIAALWLYVWARYRGPAAIQPRD